MRAHRWAGEWSSTFHPYMEILGFPSRMWPSGDGARVTGKREGGGSGSKLATGLHSP